MTRAQVTRLADKLGATVNATKLGTGWDVTVEAPAGYIWKGDDVHELVERWFTDAAGMWAAVIERMKYGVEPCTDADCEWCNGEDQP